MDEGLSMLTGFAYTILLDSDSRKRQLLDAGLSGKKVEIEEDGSVTVVANALKKVEVGEQEIDLSELPPGWFDSGESVIPADFL